MINQDYTGENLYRFSTQRERRDYVLKPGMTSTSAYKIPKEDLIAKLDEVCKEIYERTYSFCLSYHGDFLTNSHPQASIERLAQDLIMRKLKDCLSKIYSAKQANRQTIISFLKDYMAHHCRIKQYPVVLLRLDIRKFYPSINTSHIVKQLKESTKLSAETIYLLNDILQRSSMGLPLGTSVSAPLSEYAMEPFDRSISRYQGVLFYKRYVDDVVIICKDEAIANELWGNIPTQLAKLKLEINRKKSKRIVFGQNIPASFTSNGYILNDMTFLGYRIVYDPNASKPNDIQVHLSENKIKSLQSKLVKSLINWTKNHDFNILCKRLKFLTGNCIFVNTVDNVPTFAGIKYNYPHLSVHGEEILSALDSFLQRLINTKHTAIGSSFSADQRKTLAKFSFKGGYENNIFHSFTPLEMQKIKRIW